MLQTVGSHQPFVSGEPDFSPDQGTGLSLGRLFDIFKRKFFFFLFPFALVAIGGLLFAALQKPNYVSEGKILLEVQLAPDIVRPVSSMTAPERVQLLQQRVATRDKLLAIAEKFALFPKSTDVLESMRNSIQFKPVVADAQMRMSTLAVAFTVSFEYPDPEVAMEVARELVSAIVSEDDRSRSDRAAEAVNILAEEAKDLENKLEDAQARVGEAARRPADTSPTISDQQKSQIATLSALRAELAQKMSVYSEAHPAVISLKKRIALMEKTVQEPPPVAAQSRPSQVDDLESLKRQREAIEKRLSEANAKLTTARLIQKISRDQQAERLQVIETPTLPQKPIKSNRLKLVAGSLAAALILGIGSGFAAELLNGTIRGPEALTGLIPPSLTVSIPYIETTGDVIRARARFVFGAICVLIVLTVLAGLAAAIALHLPIEPSKALFDWHSLVRL
ncbi:GumC family protein [Bradyrhizobium genosp. A]|uniref:GumC family protein n=1 Tax=Bradyrhizobium genosp. A TaxID=83626 RepID=UPI003CF62FF3